ncbi:hypothetical protein LAX80_001990 [Listeria marthii]|nr:hypothetical protein LAX80_001990 [Listeria marthii]
MYLKEVRLYSDEDVSNIPFSETFHIQAEAITDLFSSLLGKIRTENVILADESMEVKKKMLIQMQTKYFCLKKSRN